MVDADLVDEQNEGSRLRRRIEVRGEAEWLRALRFSFNPVYSPPSSETAAIFHSFMLLQFIGSSVSTQKSQSDSVSCPIQWAILSLQLDDLFAAFNELSRMRLDVSVLDELVQEYCIYRDIVDSGPITAVVSDSDMSVNNAHVEGSSETRIDMLEDLNTSSLVDTLSKRADKYEIFLGIKELASKGMAVEVVEHINYLDPEFCTENPLLLFQLIQVEFLKLVRNGEHHSALKVASSHLGPLTTKDLSLLKPLKEALLTFLTLNEEATLGNLRLDALATSLQVAVGRRLGTEEPQLMKITRTTLHSLTRIANGSSFQMCKDQFMGLLWISSLEELGKSSAWRWTHEDGNGSNHISSTDIGCDENAILKVMVPFIVLAIHTFSHSLCTHRFLSQFSDLSVGGATPEQPSGPLLTLLFVFLDFEVSDPSSQGEDPTSQTEFKRLVRALQAGI
ncbi:uncharacterized protein [Primulina eburnea]|uniref:uncharacterized protein n=1 Tax=Primulina eburnea TaxID=1245227 RepID=UPI003C6C9B6A